MTPKPLHRSLTFWCGLILILFLAWGWRDSWRKRSSAARGSYGIFHGYGGIAFYKQSLIPPADLQLTRVRTIYPRTHPIASMRAPLLPMIHHRQGDFPLLPEPGTPEAFRYFVDFGVSPSWIHDSWLYLPYWMLMAPPLLTWGWLLLRRSRRQTRAMPALHPEASSHP